jgi:hypothetical protein
LTSDRKIKTNRANSRASTGPRTPRGRSRAACNALRHGLSLPICSDPAWSEQVEALTREIAGDAGLQIRRAARLVAEAQIDLRRVRQARHQLLTDALRNPSRESRPNVRPVVVLARSLVRPNAPVISPPALMDMLSSPQGDEKLAAILLQSAKRLQAFDRYERQALSRRKRAVQALDREIACSLVGNNYCVL